MIFGGVDWKEGDIAPVSTLKQPNEREKEVQSSWQKILLEKASLCEPEMEVGNSPSGNVSARRQLEEVGLMGPSGETLRER